MIVQNQTGGGGLSNAELAEATATPADVLSGKTFFAGGKDIKTGTFNLAAANATAAQVAKGYTFYAGNNVLKTGTLVAGGSYKKGTFSCPGYGDSVSISLSFPPKSITIYCRYSSSVTVRRVEVLEWCSSTGDSYGSWGYSGGEGAVYETTGITISGNGFTFSADEFPYDGYEGRTVNYYAYG